MSRWFATLLVSAFAGVIVASDGGASPADDGGSDSSNLFSFKFIAGFFGLDSKRETVRGSSKLTVVGAGFSRTGTKSLEAALVQLGHKVYDIRSMMQLGHVQRWEDAALEFKATGSTASMKVLLEEMEAQGYTATLDLPMNLFAPHLARLRPEAKVLMSVRPSEESWLEAFLTVNKILSNLVCRPWKWFLDLGFNVRLLKTLMDFDWPQPSYPEHIWRPVPWFESINFLPAFETEAAKEKWKQLHRHFQAKLQAEFPERFATFDVRTGWRPLLDFLDIPNATAGPLAATPFPWVNDQGSVEVVRMTMDAIAAGLPIFSLLLLLGFGYLVRCCSRCCRRGSKAKTA